VALSDVEITTRRFSMRSHILAEIRTARPSKCLLLALALIVLLLPFSLGAQDMNKPSVSRTPIDEQCLGNLHRIYKLIKQYLHHSGGALGFPSNLDGVYLMAKDPKPFICPADKGLETASKPDSFRTSYEIVSNPLDPKLATIPASRIAIVVEKRSNHEGQRFVLFYDGSVRAFDNRQFDRLKDDSFIDKERTESEIVDSKTGASNNPKP
jgi:hypothetical protein